MNRPFVQFGAWHLAAIALTFLVPLFFAALARAHTSPRIALAIRFAFAAELIATWILWYWLIATRGWISAQTVLPMQLCDWAAMAALVTLIRPNRRSYELAYFWGFTGTFQALLTPELFFDFPDLRFVVFFAFHGGAIASVVYLTVGLGMRPRPSSLPRVFAWSFVYLLSALAVNRLFHTNFGYLGSKPAKPSLLDLMGPWPLYIAELAGVGVILVLLLYFPFLLADILHKCGQKPLPGTQRSGKKTLPFPERHC